MTFTSKAILPNIGCRLSESHMTEDDIMIEIVIARSYWSKMFHCTNE